ncbi:MAG TPA: amino acid ABC transporter ATP-binding protein [Candidatus Dormibacteraeota bacterium]|nr:amino acid ABC transporter ATP-binding protein [Candidatus Dormibacteraeota bacterium]
MPERMAAGVNAPSSPLITVRGLRKHFGELEVLRGVDLDVHAGEVIAVIGASGSGKTTFLRCINFLEEYDEGSISVGGETVGYAFDEAGRRRRRPERENERLRARVGMVFQSFNLFPHLRVIDNVTLGPINVLGESQAAAERRGKALLEKVGLGAKVGAYPATLSGGQQQRVAIARALAMNPTIMLFDEVTSALDPELVGEVLQAMRDLADEGMTMLVVTHELLFAREVADRVIFFADGAIVEQGPPKEVLDRPKDERLQRFMRRFTLLLGRPADLPLS